MEIKIDNTIKNIIPNAKLHCIIYTTLLTEKNENLWHELENNVFPSILEFFHENSYNDLKQVAASKIAYKKLGKNPERYRISSEALYRRIKQGKKIYQLNTVVDINNFISLKTGFSVGSYDYDNIKGNIIWRLGKENENYDGIGKDNFNIEKLPVLCDNKGAFGSPTSDSKRTMINQSSKNILTIIYDFSDEDNSDLILKLASSYITKYSDSIIKQVFTIK